MSSRGRAAPGRLAQRAQRRGGPPGGTGSWDERARADLELEWATKVPLPLAGGAGRRPRARELVDGVGVSDIACAYSDGAKRSGVHERGQLEEAEPQVSEIR